MTYHDHAVMLPVVRILSVLPQAYHDLWISLLLLTHVRMVLINTTTYESIKGRRWVDNSTHGRPFYVRYPLNCFRFFFRPGGAGHSGTVFGTYGRVATQVGLYLFFCLAYADRTSTVEYLVM